MTETPDRMTLKRLKSLISDTLECQGDGLDVLASQSWDEVMELIKKTEQADH